MEYDVRLDCSAVARYASPGKEGFYHKHGFRTMITGMARFRNAAAKSERGFTA